MLKGLFEEEVEEVGTGRKNREKEQRKNGEKKKKRKKWQ